MATRIIDPHFGDADLWRDVVKHNPRIQFVHLVIETDATWLPTVLVEAGFFLSGNMVKKNQPALWRDLAENGEIVDLSWAELVINRV